MSDTLLDLDEKAGTPEAPHGYGPDGSPLAPYGYKADGTPKKDRRGRAAGTRVAAPKKRTAPSGGRKVSRSKKETRDTLVSLADLVTMPLVTASRSPLVQKRIGEAQAMAMAGDAVLVQSFAGEFADGLIALSQTKPGVLAWMDMVEEKAPYLALAQVGAQMVKAIVSNHMRPDARLANAGVTMAQIRSAQMVEEIERQAAVMGVPSAAEAA